MDYKGEVSDDEDSIIKYDETQDDFNEQILKYNRDSIRVEDKPNIKNEDMPMIDNEEIATGKIIIDEKSEEEIVVPNKIIKRTSLSENIKRDESHQQRVVVIVFIFNFSHLIWVVQIVILVNIQAVREELVHCEFHTDVHSFSYLELIACSKCDSSSELISTPLF